MGYTALYRKFRPITFEEMVGQEHITKTLRNQIISGRVGHAYLFNGGRGTGKTSSAKILARAINCLSPKDGEPCNECEICKAAISGSLTDIVEMDAASNNSVEDIRSIREEVNFLPTKAKYRVYIIDEVHMLSTGAFNALLKTLEEPPEHVKFILATTEPQKIPATILSRCQRFDFKKISNEDIVKRLKIVCSESEIEATPEALSIIAELSEGAMRDALSILERCIQDGENNITEDKIKDLVGIPKLTFVHNIVEAIINYDAENSLKTIDTVLSDGKDLNNFLWEIIKYVRDILICKTDGNLNLYSKEEKQKILELAERVSKEKLISLIYELSELENNIKSSTQKTIMFQAGIIKLCNKEASRTVANVNIAQNVQASSDLEERLNNLERYVRSGAFQMNQYVGSQPKPQKSVGNKPVARNIKIEKAKPVKETKQFWPKILEQLKQSGKRVIYTYLSDTTAIEINDMTIGIQFPKGINPVAEMFLESIENVEEIKRLISIACGKEMQIKYLDTSQTSAKTNNKSDIEAFANEQNIPLNIIE